MDDGPILGQAAVPVQAGDTADDAGRTGSGAGASIVSSRSGAFVRGERSVICDCRSLTGQP